MILTSIGLLFTLALGLFKIVFGSETGWLAVFMPVLVAFGIVALIRLAGRLFSSI